MELSKQEDTLPDPEVELSKQEDTLPDSEVELSKQEDTLPDPEVELSQQEERPRKRMGKQKVETKQVEDLKQYSVNYTHPQRLIEKARLPFGEKTTELEQDNIRESVQRKMDVEMHGGRDRELHERYEADREALERQLEEKHREEVQQLRLQLEQQMREREEEEKSRMEQWTKEREMLEKCNNKMKGRQEKWREREEELHNRIRELEEECRRKAEVMRQTMESKERMLNKKHQTEMNDLRKEQKDAWNKREEELKKQLRREMKNPISPNSRAVSPPPQAESGLRLVLLGESWASNSSAGYAILGRSCTVKRKSLRMKGRVCGRQVTLVESLGWKLHSEQRYVQQEVQRAVSLCRPAPHAFILVIPLYFAITESYCRALQESLECLSERVWGKTIVLFTFGDWQLGDTPIEQHIERQGRALQEIMEKCGNRLHVFRDENNITQVKELLEKVEDIAAGNSSNCDEDSMDLSGNSQEWDDGEQKAQRQMEKLRERQLREEQNCARRWQGRILRYEQSVRAHEDRRRNIQTLMGNKKAHELVRELEGELLIEDQGQERAGGEGARGYPKICSS
ncbi:hypothetical protein AGOR_G00032690 [Albula goreensis]|uniref:AIG1-type G domain-containing protein n=1 Tax=Albula goreensis TaxID=1534307 RepID=A0A8T3DY43_9TELE|nr:hypothetical protein AGOR_G00032690 [Albula goreensis]